MSELNEIVTEQYRYELPQERIAKYPLERREDSKLLVCRHGKISTGHFGELPSHLPPDSWLVFNNTRVIQARMSFQKETGARIEIFCLEPVEPAEYVQSFESSANCTWSCLVGNSKKWRSGRISLVTRVRDRALRLEAERLEAPEGKQYVRFHWEAGNITFAEIIESAGSTPIPPYLNREAEEGDRERYQTVYNRDPGSVAAPTAGLHFTDDMLRRLDAMGIDRRELTLHVGAGTFVPVKHGNAREHSMHAETVLVTREFLEYWKQRNSRPIAVGTTSTRSLESIYWLGSRILSGDKPDPFALTMKQWENEKLSGEYSLDDSLGALLDWMRSEGLFRLAFTTSLMIVPGYRFRAIRGLVTNFHMPGSTLLMLIAALIGDDWKKVYHTALEEDFRFLSYGDSSLLVP